MRFASMLFVVLAALCFTGCDPGEAFDAAHPAPGPSAVSEPAETPIEIDHPEYANWSRFPAGTTVIRKKEVKSDQGVVLVTTTLRLLEKTSHKVVVENQITTQRLDQPAEERPAFALEFPAKFPLPSTMQPEQFTLPSLKAKSLGPETRQAAGQDFQAEVFTWDEVNEAGPMTVRLWRSGAVPGRTIRQEITGRNHVSVEEITRIDGPADAGPPPAAQ